MHGHVETCQGLCGFAGGCSRGVLLPALRVLVHVHWLTSCMRLLRAERKLSTPHRKGYQPVVRVRGSSEHSAALRRRRTAAFAPSLLLLAGCLHGRSHQPRRIVCARCSGGGFGSIL